MLEAGHLSDLLVFCWLSATAAVFHMIDCLVFLSTSFYSIDGFFSITTAVFHTIDCLVFLSTSFYFLLMTSSTTLLYSIL